jgi:hypothetical protein
MISEEKPKPKSRSQRAVRDQLRKSEPVVTVAETTKQPDEGRWHERAAFHIAFDSTADTTGNIAWQTRAYHEEADGRATWPGMADDALMEWMRSRAGLPASASAPGPIAATPLAERAEEPPAAAPAEALALQSPAGPPPPASIAEPPDDLRLALDDMELEEIAIEQQVGEPEPARRLRAQIAIHLAGAGAHLAAADRSRYAVQVLSYELASGDVAILASDQQQLRPELLDYATAVDFDVPQVGNYQLLGTVLLPSEQAAAITLGPLLTVTS